MGFEFLTLHPERVARQDGRANLITDPSHLIPMTSVKGNKLRVGSEEVGDDLEARLTFVGTMRWLQAEPWTTEGSRRSLKGIASNIRSDEGQMVLAASRGKFTESLDVR